jgi:L-amino acid N-acyltransferase YncA
MTVTVRTLRSTDLPSALEIYNHSVRNSDATLDDTEKSIADMRSWLDHHDEPYPAVGADVNGAFAGYASLSPFAARGGYLASAEISVYVSPQHYGTGVGKALCSWLTDYAERAGYSTVIAFITSTNTVCLRMAQVLGYQDNGMLTNIGYKLGNLVDLRVYQRVFSDNLPRFDGRPLQTIIGREGGT